MNELIQLILSVATLLGFAFKVYQNIDKRDDELTERITALESRLRSHEIECQTRNKYIENILERLERALDVA